MRRRILWIDPSIPLIRFRRHNQYRPRYEPQHLFGCAAEKYGVRVSHHPATAKDYQIGLEFMRMARDFKVRDAFADQGLDLPAVEAFFLQEFFQLALGFDKQLLFYLLGSPYAVPNAFLHEPLIDDVQHQELRRPPGNQLPGFTQRSPGAVRKINGHQQLSTDRLCLADRHECSP